MFMSALEFAHLTFFVFELVTMGVKFTVKEVHKFCTVTVKKLIDKCLVTMMAVSNRLKK